jgi:D-3-phosphoglycerate dehydrogenase
VLVTSRSFGDGHVDFAEQLADAGYRVERGPAGHDLAALEPALRDAVGWIAGTGPVTREHLARAPRLRVVARYGVGTDAVDVGAAAEAGVAVTNTPGANSTAVVEHTIALLLTALRGIPAADRRVRSGDWSGWRTRELHALTVGIIGLGRIGQGVADRLAAFGCRLLGSDPWLPADHPLWQRVERSDPARIAAECDVVTLHAPGGERIIDAAWLATATRAPLLVNSARADLVDEAALADALRTGRVLAYAADTLAEENVGDTASPLLADELADRVVITPHLGAQTVEGIDGMGAMATENLLAVLRGETPPNPVTLPEGPR